MGGLGAEAPPPPKLSLPHPWYMLWWYKISEQSKAIFTFNWDFSSLSSSSTGSWPKNFDISIMVYGITIRLAGMKALTDSDCTRTNLRGPRILKNFLGVCSQTLLGWAHLRALPPATLAPPVIVSQNCHWRLGSCKSSDRNGNLVCCESLHMLKVTCNNCVSSQHRFHKIEIR